MKYVDVVSDTSDPEKAAISMTHFVCLKSPEEAFQGQGANRRLEG